MGICIQAAAFSLIPPKELQALERKASSDALQANQLSSLVDYFQQSFKLDAPQALGDDKEVLVFLPLFHCPQLCRSSCMTKS